MGYGLHLQRRSEPIDYEGMEWLRSQREERLVDHYSSEDAYGNKRKDFEYLTPKLRLEPSMLSERQVFSKTVHMVCSASRCISIVEEIMHRREQLQQKGKTPPGVDASKKPFFIWEPVPNLCTPEEQDKFFAANKVVDVVSPNELELGMMFGQPGWSEESEFGRDIVKRILDSGIGPQGEGLISIRAGKDGSYSYTRSQRIWLPAYHQPGTSGATKVVDPTGAGNSYLGALAQGMVSAGRDPAKVIDSVLAGSENWRKATQDWGKQNHYLPALIFATVAASFVVEQIGVPRLSTTSDGTKELWNETEFTERVRLYTKRLYRTLEESPQRHLRGQLTH